MHISDIVQEITSDTLVLFDIDDTLLNTQILLGNSAWWQYFITTLNASGYDKKYQPEITSIIQKILTKVPVLPIDPISPEIIKSLQCKGIMTLGLTARFLKADYLETMGDLSHYQLKSFGVNFSQTPLPNCNNPRLHQFFLDGIIFTNHNPKGPYLKEFLALMGLHPKKIVFIDDSVKQMSSVENTVESLGIEFTGFRYGTLDHFHSAFNPLVANIQLEALVKEGQLVSDEEALQFAKAHPELDPHYFVNALIQNWKK